MPKVRVTKSKFFFPKTDRTKCIGKGLRPRGGRLAAMDALGRSLVIMGDNTKYTKEMDAWRSREGIKIIGATAESAQWELNRTYGQKMIRGPWHRRGAVPKSSAITTRRLNT